MLRWLLIGSQPQKFPRWNLKLVSVHRGQGETAERGRATQMGSRQDSWARQLTCEAFLACHKSSRSLQPLARITVYAEPSWGSVMYTVQMVSATHYSLKAAPLKELLPWKRQAEKCIPKTGERVASGGPSGCPGPARRSSGGQILSMTSSSTSKI